VADLNHWPGLDAGGAFQYGGGHHTAADATVGLGWIYGDPVTSEAAPGTGGPQGSNDGLGADYTDPITGLSANDLKWDWYRIPQWTYITSGEEEGVHIDPEYRDDLVWCYMQDGNRPHGCYLCGDNNQGGTMDPGADNWWNPWNANGWTTYTQQTLNRAGGSDGSDDGRYFRISLDTQTAYGFPSTGARPCFINTSTWTDPTAGPTSNVIFFGDTWFVTPGNYSTLPDGNPYPQWLI
jgi:hypothetical protein